ncbi:hypothetical protein VPH35_131558 [Triticum aestivum]
MIVVKKLVENSMVPRDEAFSNEVQNMMALRHENIVKLVGFCHEGQKEVVQKDGKYFVANIFQYLRCYEYLPMGSLGNNLFESNGMDWNTRFRIIKGICQGLLFLHKIPIVHMNLKPQNILLGDDMEPKIAEFSTSKLLGQKLIQLNTQDRSDIYDLGVLILEITTGKKNGKKNPSGREYIYEVHRKWTDGYIASKHCSLGADSLQRIKVCILLGLKCVHIDRKMRHAQWTGKLHMPLIMKPLEPLAWSSRRLIVQPPELRFSFEPKRLISCSIYLTKLPLCGVVLPNCIYTINVTMHEHKKQQSRNGEFLTLRSSTAREEQLTNAHPHSLAGDEVIEVKLCVVCDPQEGHWASFSACAGAPEQPAASSFFGAYHVTLLFCALLDQVIASQNYRLVLSVDVHPNKPWILTSNRRGCVCIWNYQTKTEENSFQVSAEEPVYSAMLIEREEWLVAGGGDGYIYVYRYDTMEEIMSFEAHDGRHIRSLARSPTHTFLLSASDDHVFTGFKFQTGAGTGFEVCVFKISNAFSLMQRPGVIIFFQKKCNATLDGQPDGVLCLHYLTDRNQQRILSGYLDGAAKIWDPEKECCVSAPRGNAKSVNALCWHPELHVVITGSLDGTVQICKSTKPRYRLENVIGFNLGYIQGLTR